MERIERTLLVVVLVLVAATVAGAWALWPGAGPETGAGSEQLFPGVVRVAETYECPEDAQDLFERTLPCQRIEAEVTGGPYAGRTFQVDTAEQDYPVFDNGDRIRVGVSTIEGEDPTFYIADFARLRPLLVLLVVFLAVLFAVGRWHGARSLVGLLLSLGVIVGFVVPAILDGQNPFAVAVVGAFAVMLTTLYPAHGLTLKTTSAVVGTAGALALTAVLGLIFVTVSQLTGFSSEEATLARFAIEGLDLRGLVLAGLVIGAMGVLDDVTVAQASTVFALHDANPDQATGELFRRAMTVGRDHIASTVNTLVLAYVGASIPLIVLFSTGGQPLTEVLNAEVVAEEIVKTLVGSIGLISAVPLTTALAAAVAVRRTARGLPVPAYLREDADEAQLSDDEVAHRRWIDFLRAGSDEASAPRLPRERENDEDR